MNSRALSWGLFVLCLSMCFYFSSCASSSDEIYDVLIKNTKIVDGTGKDAFYGDIAIKEEKIVAIGRIKADAELVIEGKGLVSCPGFVDTHTHADSSILQYPLAENYVMQGVTTVLGGNCGVCPAPSGEKSFGQWLSEVEDKGISINLAQLVGHNTIRTKVMGDDFKRFARPDEIEEMKKLVEDAMKNGAFGISTFFDPSPGEYADREEIVELVKIAKDYGGLFSPHTRHHQNQWFSENLAEYGYGIYHGPAGEAIAGRYHGLLEAVEISKEAGNISLLIAHFTPAFVIPQPHPESLQKAVAEATLAEIVDRAREDGLKIHYNVIACSSSIGSAEPILASFFNPNSPLPQWLKKMEKEEFIQRLRDEDFQAKLQEVILSGRFKLGMLHPLTDPYWIDCYKILSCKIGDYEGKTFGEICRERCPNDIAKAVYEESLKLLFEILLADPGATWALILDKREFPGALPVLLRHPAGMPCTDGSIFPLDMKSSSELSSLLSLGWKPSPIYYGLFPYYIDTFVKEKKALTLEEAIMKATSIPAQEVLGLKDRGALEAGSFADIVIFNLEELHMAGDFTRPNVPPQGIEYVFINGKVVYSGMKHTGEKSGKVLRRQ